MVPLTASLAGLLLVLGLVGPSRMAAPRTKVSRVSRFQTQYLKNNMLHKPSPVLTTSPKLKPARVMPEPEGADTDLPDQLLELAENLRPKLRGCSIYLVGMMGSGKTNIGRVLHNSLQYAFFDTDELVEALTGKSVYDIFKDDGEESFRAVEAEVLQQLKAYTRILVATGGGAVSSIRNWDAMRNGLVVWLDAPPGILAERLVGTEQKMRPLLDLPEDAPIEDLEAKIAEISHERRQMYDRADVTVSLLEGYENGSISPASIAFKVLKEIERKIDEKIKNDEQKKEWTINTDNINKIIED